MFHLDQLDVPIIAAPMAGGPSSPDLVAAVSRAGGLGFLAGGYRTASALAEQIETCRQLTDAPFGMNLFCPPEADGDVEAVRAYRARLLPLAERYGVELPEPRTDDDGWHDKLDLVVSAGVAVVSFTFGLPETEVVERLHGRDIAVVATVTSSRAAEAAAARGVDAVVVQGSDAGGHQATLSVDDEPNRLPLIELLDDVRRFIDMPLIAAGGIVTGAQIASLLASGASAVQLGTAFMLTPEAGTSATVRAAYTDPRFTTTASTRAFSGRFARGLRNRFVDEFDPLAPAAYPAVNQVTGPIRSAAGAAGDADHTHLWAGTGWREARATSAEQVLTDLWEQARHPA